MSWSSRRAIFVLAAVAVLGTASVVQHVYAQKAVRPALPPVAPGAPIQIGPGGPGAPGVPKKEGFDLGSLTLPKDDDLKERVESAVDKIKSKLWVKAVENLQELVGREQDVFIPVTRTDADGREITSYVSVKEEANRLIGNLPKEGRNAYEVTFGPKAAAQFKQARTNNDHKLMGQVVGLYFYTEAGAEAAGWLGTYLLDRGDFRAASRYFGLLVNKSSPAKLSDKVLLKAAYAFHHAADPAGKEVVFKEMQRRNLEVKLRNEVLAATDLQAAINKMVASSASQNANDSRTYRGNASRNAMLAGGVPFLEATWRQKMVKVDETAQELKKASDLLQSRNIPNLSSFFPVTATVSKGEKKIPLIIYRSYWGIHAVHLKSGKLEWDSPSDWSFDRVLSPRDHDHEKRNATRAWLNYFVQSNTRPQIVFENSVLGSVSADDKYAYAVEDLAVPPPPFQNFDGRFPGGGVGSNYGEKVNGAIKTNKLQAFSLATGGKLDWELGGPEEKDKSEVAETYFLGPPLPLGDRIYVLTEKQQEVRLLCIDPAAKGKVVSAQTLANTKDIKLAQDPLRRTQAAHLAYGEGILVVPTNAGAVFGVDLLANTLLWAYPYREKPAPTPTAGTAPGGVPGGVRIGGRPIQASPMNSHWKVTAPIVQDGKVVFTAPDAKAIHCVSLRDGLPIWTQTRRDDDLYLGGVFNGKVVIVGKNKTRGLNLANGEPLWELDTGVPSGQGAASPIKPGEVSDVLYYLPVKESVGTREPEICTINVDKGIIHAHTKSRKKEIPGNLLFYEGDVISQTTSEIVAYPQLDLQLAKMNDLVKKNPEDPDALTDRGDYLLDKGDLAGAIADFRKALGNKPAQATKVKARNKLYEALTEYFQRDFNAAEEYLKEYEALCKVDLEGTTGAERTALQAEERRRRANFLCLVGKGREAQNRLVEAFERYMELGEEARKDELIQVVDEPSVKAAPDVWSQGRIAAMVANAKDPKAKKELEDLITARWKKLQSSKEPSLNELRKFVQMFGSLFSVGKEARLALADRLMEDDDLNSMLEAEQQLSLMRNEGERPEVVARAIEGLARLNTRKGYLEDAAFYYRLLGQKYPKVVVSDGKTGADYLDDLATDKRFLPYLDTSNGFNLRGKARIKANEEKGGFTANQVYEFAQEGETLPFFTRQRLGLQLSSHSLKLVDSGTGEERWNLSLTRTQFQQIASINGQPNQPTQVKFSYQNLGHLVVLQLGHMVFGIDPLNKGRVLWERNLSTYTGSVGYTGLTVDPKDSSLTVTYSDGWMQRLGQAGPLQGGVICLQMRDSLTAIDPVTGRTLWTRSDVNSRTHVFGDDDHVFVVGIGETGTAVGTRVFRAYDGVSVRVPDFSAVYDQRVRLVGRSILATRTNEKNQTVEMRIYDVLAGKDQWKKEFAANSLVLRSEDDRLAGVVEPSGQVRVVDIANQKEVLNASLDDPKHIEKAQAVHLVSDKEDLYLAIQGENDPNLVPWGGGVQSNMMAGTGLRAVPVNGEVYCFNRATGKRRWRTEVPMRNQMLVVSRFEEMPIVLMTARAMEWKGNPPARTNVTVSSCHVFNKRNGKWVYTNQMLPPGMYFHELALDPRAGKIDLVGYQLKVTFNVTQDDK